MAAPTYEASAIVKIAPLTGPVKELETKLEGVGKNDLPKGQN